MNLDIFDLSGIGKEDALIEGWPTGPFKERRVEDSKFSGRVKIFLDTGDQKTIFEMADHPRVQGFTTNPSLVKAAGVTDYEAYAREVLTKITDKPISFEVFADEPSEMARQARKIATWGKNVYVKIPVTNSVGHPSRDLIRELTQDGVQLNLTAIFTLDQVQEICDALKGGAAAVVSVFAGRVADSGRDPVPMMQKALEICQATGPQVELLWASCREFFNIVQADQIGVHIITAPGGMIKKLDGLNKDLNQFSLETVQAFKRDAEAAGFRL